MNFELTYRRFSERSILVEWPHKIDEKVLRDVLVFKNHLLNSSIKSIIYISNAYSSILIFYDITIDKINDEILLLKRQYLNRSGKIKPVSRLWKIPVCYDNEFALDLDEISKENMLSKLDIIRLHSETKYTVYFIGFLPGFLYLGGLDERLYFPRKESPRIHIKKGAVGIGGCQTGIYPNISPGGWNIIGNSPLEFFNTKNHQPCFANSGDKIEFVSVNLHQYYDIKEQIANNSYHIENEVIDG